MTDFAALLQPDRGQPARTIRLVTGSGMAEWLEHAPEQIRSAAAAAGFKGAPDTLLIVPGDQAEQWSAIVGIDGAGGPWSLAAAAAKLPGGCYRVEGTLPRHVTLGWLLAQHRFDRYRTAAEAREPRVLLAPDVGHIDAAVRLAEATALVRDLVDIPAGDLGPAELVAAIEQVGQANGATITVTAGADLARDYPMIHAVGRAATAERAPRLAELTWGDPAHPRIAIVGKGVCFDSGGLDIKPAAGMLLMKKDMGGAATALALAQLVMEAKLPVRLHLLVPAVENAISAESFRPGDVLRSRQGLHVEIGNTDAEGRLILADALYRACAGEGERAPELVLDFATLTGAARVALGPDLPALFANDDALAGALLAGGDASADPLWRLPLWKPYLDMLRSDIADINNAGSGGFAGAITAALFLERFVPEGVAWAHLDTFSWRPSASPGRPKGGEALGLRAAWAMLRHRYGDASDR